MQHLSHLVYLIFVGLLLGLAGPPALAQTFRWVRTGAGPLAEAQVSALAVANGQLTATGVFTDVITFNNQVFSAKGPYNSAAFTGQWVAGTGSGRWLEASDGTASAGSTRTSAEGTAAGLDAAGNSYVAYTIYNDTRFGSVVVAGPGNPNANMAVLVKYSSIGEVLWTKGLQGSLGVTVAALAVQPDGSCYLTGRFAGTLALGGQTLTSGGPAGNPDYYNGFVAKLTSTGDVQWARAQTGPGGIGPTGLALGPAGEVFVCGQFFLSITLVPAVVLPVRDSGSGGYGDGYLAKYDAAGSVQWAQDLGGTDGDQANAVAADAAGNVFVTGTFGDNQATADQSAITIGGTTLRTTSVFGGTYRPFNPDGYLAKFTAQGQASWAQGIQAGGLEGPQALATTPQGDCYVSGYAYDGVSFGPQPTDVLRSTVNGYVGFVAKYGPAGNVRWLTSYAGNFSDYKVGVALATDGQGHVFVGGAFHGASTTFSSLTVAGGAATTTTAFVAALDDAQVLPTRPALAGVSLLQIYPNPSTDLVRLEWPSSYQPQLLTLRDALGRPVRTDMLAPGITSQLLSLSGLPAGIYSLQLQAAAGKVLTQRLTIR
ncbi:hypothetical protein GCM10027422_31030 [Hymenobacter arcticus]